MDLSELTSEELIEELKGRGFVVVNREVARLVRKVFLPANPSTCWTRWPAPVVNKLRVAAPSVVDAVRAFIAAVNEP